MNREIVSAITRHLSAERPFVIATIISQQGSTPRMPGTKMIIAENGASEGTVGGGLLEAAVIDRAREVLQTGIPIRMQFKLTAAARETMDMICGGVAEVLIDHIDPASPSGACLDQWCRLCTRDGGGGLLTIIQEKGQGQITTDHLLVGAPAADQGEWPPNFETLVELAEAAAAGSETMTVVTTGNLQGVVEIFQQPEALFIFGAGHVSQPTAHMARLVGFRVVVLDDRGEFANPDRFPGAHKTVVLDDYQRAMREIKVTDQSFIVIVTRGHLHDQTVLAQALRTPAAYVGMIGSRTKRDTIYHNLRRQGFNDKDLARVASPIGLSIGAQTPEEIAVSIVAELIKRRSEMRS